MFKRVLILAFSGFAVVAMAQLPASQPPATATSARPAHSCMRPGQPRQLATDNQGNVFNNDVKAYPDCLQTFVKARGALVKLHSEIGNSAVKEVDDYVFESNKKKEDAANQGCAPAVRATTT